MLHWERQADLLVRLNILAFVKTHLIDGDIQVMMGKRPFFTGDFETYVNEEFKRREIDFMDIKSLYFDSYEAIGVYSDDMDMEKEDTI